MNHPLSFFVEGLPRAQGSKRHVGNGVMVESSKQLPAWRKAVSEKARHEASAQQFSKLTGPTYVVAHFYFPRPKGHYGTGRNASRLKESAPVYHVHKPDIDKLLRALLDGLVMASVMSDDSRVVGALTHKLYGETPGVQVEVNEVA